MDDVPAHLPVTGGSLRRVETPGNALKSGELTGLTMLQAVREALALAGII